VYAANVKMEMEMEIENKEKRLMGLMVLGDIATYDH